MSDFSDLQKRVVEFRDARDSKQLHNPKDLAKGFERKMVTIEKKYPVSKSKGTNKKYTELIDE